MTTPESLNIDDASQNPTTPDKKKVRSGYGVEIVKSPENSYVVDKLKPLELALSHDTAITAGQVLEVEKSLDSMKVSVGGQEVMLGDIKDIPDWEKNLKIWEKIQDGNFRTYHKLTCVTPQIAELLSEHFAKEPIKIKGLTSISDAVAECLSKHQGGLDLGLTSISDKAAEYFSHHQATLILGGLTSMSDSAAEHLSKHGGQLFLAGLTSISDSVVEHLSKYRGHLGLNGLTSISDTAAECLSKRGSGTELNGLTSMSDFAARCFSEYQGYIYLNHLNSISDIAAKYLAGLKHLSVPADIDAKIEKFRKFKS